MMRPEEEPDAQDVIAPGGDPAIRETHPAFGMATVNRVQHTPGASLYDSEIRHATTIRMQVYGGERERHLHRDWLRQDGLIPKIEVLFSEAQWGAFVSSFGQGEGVPCTITVDRTTKPGEDGTRDPRVPGIPFNPRTALSIEETRSAAHRTYDKVREALALVEEKPTKANVRALRIQVENAAPNVEFAAKSLTEHVENVVTKARSDIEGMVTRHAETLGLTTADLPVFELGSATPQGDDLDAT